MTINSVDIGGLIGDVTFEMSAEIYYPDFLQAPMPVAGTGKVVSATGSITCTMAEWTYAVLSTMFAQFGANSTTSYTIGSGSIGTITELDSIVVTGTELNSGKDFKVTMVKGRITSPVATTLSKSQEANIEVTFESLSVVNDPDTFAMYIEIEK